MITNESISTGEEQRQERAPELRQSAAGPKGVLRRNLKMQLYLGIAVLFIVATAVSSLRRRPAEAKKAQPGQPPVPFVEVSQQNIEEVKAAIQQQQREAAHPPSIQDVAFSGLPYGQTPATLDGQTGAAEYGPNGMPIGYRCSPGQPCPPVQAGSAYGPQPSQQLQMEQQEKELAYRARFASNLAYSQGRGMDRPSNLTLLNQSPNTFPSGREQEWSTNPGASQPMSAMSAETPQPLRAERQTANNYKRSEQVNINSATGPPYVVYEGTTIDTALINRLDGDASGPVKVLVTNPVYSHDQQHVLIPEGTVALGEVHKIGGAGFGQQRRLAVVFHRLIMPDGYSVDLDQFQGLNQIGETGLKDKVNHHYLQVFGTSIALGVIAAGAEMSNGGGALTGNGEDAFKYGVASSVSNSATTVLDRFLNIPPTITVREGHRVKVYISQDLLLPAYEAHTIPNTF